MADKNSNGESKTERKKPTCFVVSPIGATGSPERKHANVTLRFIIEPVLIERCGFQRPLRADTLGEPGMISRQIISQLLNADLVVADLTDRNPNVFYELAIRHGTGKPFVQLITRGQVLPFDVGHQRTIFFDRTDLDDVEDCKNELERQVKAVMAEGFKVETPIGQTLDYEKLRGGGTVEQALAKLADQVAEMNGPTRRFVLDSSVLMAGRPDLVTGRTSVKQIIDLVKERTQRFLNEKGYLALAPHSLVGSITAAVGDVVEQQGHISVNEIDGLVSAITDKDLLSTIEQGP